MGRVLGKIASGDLSKDARANEAYYAGDFKALAVSLRSIQTNLTDMIRDITQVAGQVDISADQVATGAHALSQGTLEQAASIDGLVSNVTEITTQIQNSTVRCGSASEQVDKACRLRGGGRHQDGAADGGHPQYRPVFQRDWHGDPYH